MNNPRKMHMALNTKMGVRSLCGYGRYDSDITIYPFRITCIICKRKMKKRNTR